MRLKWLYNKSEIYNIHNFVNVENIKANVYRLVPPLDRT